MRELDSRSEAERLETGFSGKEGALRIVITEELFRRRGGEKEHKEGRKLNGESAIEGELPFRFSFSFCLIFSCFSYCRLLFF